MPATEIGFSTSWRTDTQTMENHISRKLGVGSDFVHCQSERWSRQDYHHDQPGQRFGQKWSPRAGCRPGPSVQRNNRIGVSACRKPSIAGRGKTWLVDFDHLPGAAGGLAWEPPASDAVGLSELDEVQVKQIVGRLLEGIQEYDFVLIDCPPSLGQLTRTALSASDEVLMPIQCEFFAMEGLTQMIEVIRDVMRTEGNRLEFGGILLTMYDSRLELTHEVDEEVREFFGEIVFETVIPRDVEVCEAPSHGISVLDYAPRSRGSRAYLELGMEVLEI